MHKTYLVLGAVALALVLVAIIFGAGVTGNFVAVKQSDVVKVSPSVVSTLPATCQGKLTNLELGHTKTDYTSFVTLSSVDGKSATFNINGVMKTLSLGERYNDNGAFVCLNEINNASVVIGFIRVKKYMGESIVQAFFEKNDSRLAVQRGWFDLYNVNGLQMYDNLESYSISFNKKFPTEIFVIHFVPTNKTYELFREDKNTGTYLFNGTYGIGSSLRLYDSDGHYTEDVYLNLFESTWTLSNPIHDPPGYANIVRVEHVWK
jgi:hypothetical protein